jgi:hypothetical protein
VCVLIARLNFSLCFILIIELWYYEFTLINICTLSLDYVGMRNQICVFCYSLGWNPCCIIIYCIFVYKRWQGGVVLLFGTLCLHVGYSSAAKKLSVEVGGAKRLHAFSTLVSAGILWPWAAFTYLSTEVCIQAWTYIGGMSIDRKLRSLNPFQWHAHASKIKVLEPSKEWMGFLYK